MESFKGEKHWIDYILISMHNQIVSRFLKKKFNYPLKTMLTAVVVKYLFNV